MSTDFTNDAMLEMFIYETSQLIEKLEQSILVGEKERYISESMVNEIFRIMHTVKGSAAMMMFHNITKVAHTMEDLFSYIREHKSKKIEFLSLADLVLSGIDFIKVELEKIKNGDTPDGAFDSLVYEITCFLSELKETKASTQNIFKAHIYFEEGCEMENIRAYSIVHNLKDCVEDEYHIPGDILENNQSVETIRCDGFQIYMKTKLDYEKIFEVISQSSCIKSFELTQLEYMEELLPSTSHNSLEEESRNTQVLEAMKADQIANESQNKSNNTNIPIVSPTTSNQSMISVAVSKLDTMMDLVGEMVIAEAMVVQNPDLNGLELTNFHKAAAQLHKITKEMQDIVMSMRMVPLFATFQKMNRIVRDMCRKLNKEVKLEIIGESIEVDKNIIEHLSDPIMHLVRNSLDHGIESEEERVSKGKRKEGTLTLEARNAGSDVLIIVKDDGRGLDREKIIKKAKENNLLHKNPTEMTDRGFSI